MKKAEAAMNKNALLERQNKLLEALECTTRISIEDAMKYLGVSRSTVTRLFIDMERKGLILRIQGGASLIRNNLEYTYDSLETVRLEEKKCIGSRAAALVESGDVLFLDAGTTLPHMCVALAKRIEAGELHGVRIFTRSPSNLNVLQRITDVFLIGGEYRHVQRDFLGYIAEEAVRPLHFTKFFLGTDGIDRVGGLTTMDFPSARLNRIVIANSTKKYVLADSSKFGKIASVQFAEIPILSGLVTDRAGEEKADAFAQAGVPVYLA